MEALFWRAASAAVIQLYEMRVCGRALIRRRELWPYGAAVFALAFMGGLAVGLIG